MRMRVCVRVRVRVCVGEGVCVRPVRTVQRVSRRSAQHRTHSQPHAPDTTAPGHHIAAKQSARRSAAQSSQAAESTASDSAGGAGLIRCDRHCRRCTIVGRRCHCRSGICAHRWRQDGAAGRVGAARGTR